MSEDLFKAAFLVWIGYPWKDGDPISVKDGIATGTMLVLAPDGETYVDYVFNGQSFRVGDIAKTSL